MSGYHQPVMLEECMAYMIQANPGIYADCTLGGGGHSAAILQKLLPGSELLCLDRDLDAIAHASRRLHGQGAHRIFHSAFSSLHLVAAESTLDGVLFDLGVSSWHLDEEARGFTFTPNAPLDMRMDRTGTLDAESYLRQVEEFQLAKILKENADLERSKALARRLKEQLEIVNIGAATSTVIRNAVDRVFADRPHKSHSLYARVFQAVRMEINDELFEIEKGLQMAVAALRPGGRLCVISYHSAEDRKVKQTLSVFEVDCICPPSFPVCRCGGGRQKLRKVVRKPLLPSSAEIAVNPRARSAKLRVCERI